MSRFTSTNLISLSRLAIVPLVAIQSFGLGMAADDTSNSGACRNLPLYARHGIENRGKIRSPDRTKTLVLRFHDDDKSIGYISLVLREGQSTLATRLDGFRSEILWSPDSSRFAVNQTTGGGGFGQKTYVFSVQSGRLRKIDVSLPVEKAFGSPVKCELPIPPNTAIIKWLDSNTVLVVAEVVPVSICKCSGSFRSYEVSLTDLGIKRSYSQAETNRLFFDSLGCELRNPQSTCAIGERKHLPRSDVK